MSAVLAKTKQHYRRAIGAEALIFGVSGVCLMLWNFSFGLSFLLGVLCSLLPFALSVYWMFFRSGTQSGSNLKAFYASEALKWGAAIVLIVAVLLGFKGLQIYGFFGGYFAALLANNLVPFLLLKSKSN